MANEQYVCHISGQGATWAVKHENSYDWCVKGTQYDGLMHYLPKCEYRLCPAPPRWVDVTAGCDARVDTLNRQQIWHGNQCIDGACGYRFRKVQVFDEDGQHLLSRWLFVVEKEEAQP